MSDSVEARSMTVDECLIEAKHFAADNKRMREAGGGVTLQSLTAIALAAEVCRLREESRLFREAGHAAELRIVELREEIGRERGASKPWLRSQVTTLETKLARVEELIELEHDDSTVRVSRLRAALRGEP